MRKHHLITSSLIVLTTMTSGCGGGDTETPTTVAPVTTANTVSEAYAKSVSANTATVSNDAVLAQTQTIVLSQTVIANAQVNQTYNCAGGGTASFQLTGAGAAQLINGALDAGENYTFTFASCKSTASAAAVNGSMTLLVNSATSAGFSLSTTSTNLAVVLPQGRISMSGSSTIQFSSSTQGSAVTSNLRWTTPNIAITTSYNLRSSTFTLSNVDLTNQVSTTNGVVSASQTSGTSTWAATLPSGTFSITTATQGTVTYDSNGQPTAGSWTATFPNNRLSLSVASGTARITVDLGADGTTDATYNLTIPELIREAG